MTVLGIFPFEGTHTPFAQTDRFPGRTVRLAVVGGIVAACIGGASAMLDALGVLALGHGLVTWALFALTGVAVGTTLGAYQDALQADVEKRARVASWKLDAVTNIVAHDFRNPLTMARGCLDEARKTGDAEAFDQVEHTLDYLEKMATSVDAFVDDTDSSTTTRRVRFREEVERACQFVDLGRVSLDLERDGHLEADPLRLSILLRELLENAVEHGGDDLTTIRVGVTNDGFYVADDGRGIPRSDWARAFESWYSTGTDVGGLGLPLVWNIAEAHGWTVRVDESEAAGTRFEFVDES